MPNGGALLVTSFGADRELLPAAIAFRRIQQNYGLPGSVTLLFFRYGLGVVAGAELNAALADAGDKALRGEVYAGPFSDELEIEEPTPGEDIMDESAPTAEGDEI